MTHYLHKHLELLKQLTLSRLNIKHILPSDCKYISAEILKKTNKQISETTLKRVYGFAFSEFKPSLFTINTMAEFCGFEGWDSFCTIHPDNPHVTILKREDQWLNTLEKTNRITHATLQTLKNRSGIPYDQTISRDFLNEHLFAFFAEDATATILTAPAGYGKTIAITHWVEDYLLQQQLPSQKDIVLFFSGSALINAYTSGHDLNNWLMALLGLDADKYVNNLFNPDSGFEGWFYLVIDGLDDFNYKGSQFQEVLSQLIDIISLYQNTRRLKVIITMRSVTWINYQHMIINKNSWFTGFMLNDEYNINVPLLCNNEILKLYQNQGLPKPENLHYSTLEFLSYPLFYQYYFQDKSSSPSLDSFNEINVFDIISAYILNKIWKSRYCMDMINFLRGFVDDLDIKNQNYTVNKLRLTNLIKTYHHAYEELLHIGYLQNVNSSYGTKLCNYVKFNHVRFIEHAIAQKLYYDNNECFDMSLLKDINALTYNDGLKLNVLKWCIYQTITNNKTFSFALLSEFCISAPQKADLALFIGQLLNKQMLISNNSYPDNFKDDVSGYFIGLEYISGNHEQTLQTVLNLKNNLTSQILLKCSLCIIAIIQLDIKKLELLINDLKEYDQDSFKNFPVNPVNCLDTIYYFLKHGILKKESFEELTRFYFNPPASGYDDKINVFNEVIYILAIQTLSICNSQVKTLRFINKLNTVYPKGSATYKFLIKVFTADTLLALNKTTEANKIVNMLSARYPLEQADYTAIMKVYFHALKIKLQDYSAKHDAMLNEMNALTKLCDESAFKLVKVRALAAVLYQYPALKENNRIFNIFYYDLVKTARTSGCRTETFLTLAS